MASSNFVPSLILPNQAFLQLGQVRLEPNYALERYYILFLMYIVLEQLRRGLYLAPGLSNTSLHLSYLQH